MSRFPRINEKKIQALKTLYATGDYTQAELCDLLDMKPYAVCYHVNDKFRKNKKLYSKSYYRENR